MAAEGADERLARDRVTHLGLKRRFQSADDPLVLHRQLLEVGGVQDSCGGQAPVPLTLLVDRQRLLEVVVLVHNDPQDELLEARLGQLRVGTIRALCCHLEYAEHPSANLSSALERDRSCWCAIR